MITQLSKVCTSSFRAIRLHFHQNFSSKKSSRDNVKMERSVNLRRPPDNVNKRNNTEYSVGNTYHGFLCTRIEEILDFRMICYIFRHSEIGSELLYLKRDDSNNVFSVNFRTTPFDSSGLPHILEHTVLCGSEKFPVRDPFFKMINRSVATFMNAMTGPDYTIYPFSTMNETDFRNLQKIYLDAAFKPNLGYMDFLQEGWRLEHANIRDKKSEYQIKGVVYNEMKGAFSENSRIFSQQLLNSMLPDTYGFVSGGNPLEIPKLTYKDLIDFHKKYYHPSNAKFFCYGTFNLNETLSNINEYLLQYEPQNVSYSRIPNHKRWIEARNVHVSSRYDNIGAPFEKQNQISISLLMSDVTNVYETFVTNIISELLVRGPNSYFYKSLIEPNFSGGYNQTTGYNYDTKDTFFSVGLQDLKVDEFSRVQQIFDSTIEEAIAEGFNKDHVESVLHLYELSLRHQTPKFGLRLLYNLSPIMNHEGDVIDSLKVSLLIGKLRKNMEENPKYLQQKIERYFKNNNHRLTLTMSPEDSYESNFKEAEQMIIREKVSNLSPEQKDKIYNEGLKLDELQKAPPNVDVLPCLSMDDVKNSPDPYSLHVKRQKNVPTQVCTVETNQISYLKLLFDANHLSPEQIKLLPLFTNVITEMGTKNYDYRTFDKMVTTKTSGINFDLHFADDIYDNKMYNVGVIVSVHALEQNTTDMFDLCCELFNNFKFDDESRLNMLLENYLSNISTGVADSGHMYAMQSSSGLVTSSAKLKAMLCGIEHIEYTKNLILNNTCEQIMSNLKDVAQNIFNVKSMRTALNSSEKMQSNLMNNYEKFINKLPERVYNPVEMQIDLQPPSCQHFIMNIPVNYCAKSLLTVPFFHRDHPVLRILAQFLTSKYLLPVVRERNGAYGAGAKIGTNGIFSFYSYRDPNSQQTLDTFDNTFKWLQSNPDVLNEQTLFEAKLGVLQLLDMPQSPGNKGIDFFLYGISQEIHHIYRQRMLNVTLNELKKVAKLYFEKEAIHYGKCVLGPENKNLQKKKEKWTMIAGN